MSRFPSRSSQNLRLAAVLVLTGLAVGSTLLASAAAEQSVVADVEEAAAMPSVSSDTELSVSPASDLNDEPIEVVAVGNVDGPEGGIGLDIEAVMGSVETDSTVIDPVLESVGIELDGGSCDPTIAGQALLDAEDAFHVEDFSTDTAAWDALSGSWSIVDGEYHQVDGGGYDLISQLRVDPPDRYRVSVSLRAIGDDLGGGLILGQPLPADRSGATVVDFTEGGTFLRWGRYDTVAAQYQYLGGVSMPEDFDTSVAHELTVEVRDERTMVMVDGVEVGSFEPLPFGRLGFVTSRSQVAFDSLRIVEVGR